VWWTVLYTNRNQLALEKPSSVAVLDTGKPITAVSTGIVKNKRLVVKELLARLSTSNVRE
jgi:hypothetical protein